jgi:hypothetical protein
MSKLDRLLFDVDLYKGAHSPDSIWKLHRLNDELIRTSYDVMWIEFDENGRFKQKYDVPAVGRSLLMSPFNAFFTWQTTAITSFQQSVNEDEIVFSTKNSKYILERITNPETNED